MTEAIYRCMRCGNAFASLGELDPGDRICTRCIKAARDELEFIRATGLPLPVDVVERDARVRAWKEAL